MDTIPHGLRELPPAEEKRLMDEASQIKRLFASDPGQALGLAEDLWGQIPGDTLEEKVLTAFVPQMVSASAAMGAAEAGNRAAALTWLERYHASYGYRTQPTSLSHRGAVYYRLGDLDKAREVFAEMLSLYGKRAFREENPNFLRLAQGKKVEPEFSAPPQIDEDEIDRLAELGNEALDAGDWQRAVDVWTQALDLVPEPKDTWEATMWLCGSIADAYFTAGRYPDVIDHAQRALDASDRTNPFLWLRLGQAQYETGDHANALNSLTSAFMLGGHDVFHDDDPKYLDFLRTNGVRDV